MSPATRRTDPGAGGLRLCSLASGSKGNCTVIHDGERILVIDSGISMRRVRKGLAAVGFDEDRLAGILITHEHTDHCAGVGPLARAFELAVHATAGTFEGSARALGAIDHRVPVEAGGVVTIGDFQVETFSTYHDARDPVAMVVRSARVPDRAVGVVTDLGFVSTIAFQKLAACRTLLFEANHDIRMLLEGPYPWELKRRIMSRHGHLDNESSARALDRLCQSGTRRVLLAHLSETNNSPGVVLETMKRELSAASARSLSLHLAPPDGPSEVLEA